MHDSPTFDGLTGELMSLFQAGARRPLADADFRDLALRVFAYQFEANATYRGFCEGRGVSPGTVARWQDVPAVPTTAFKHLDLVSGDPARAEARYLTSGTTAGRAARGRHLVLSRAIYRGSALAALRARLLPDPERLPVLSLVPRPDAAPESSLSAMMGFVADEWGGPTFWLAAPDGAPDVDGFMRAADHVVAEGRGALVAGTAFAFVHLLDAATRRGWTTRLPEGSRVMETGGFKGRSRVVEKEDLYRGLGRCLGVPPERIVNEYGMTELLSQLYEPVLDEGLAGRGVHVAPPWLRARALDPVTLAEVPEGSPGILAFCDLANVGSVAHVLTQDVGWVEDGRVRLRGRSEGAEPRGCSLALEEFLSASQEGA